MTAAGCDTLRVQRPLASGAVLAEGGPGAYRHVSTEAPAPPLEEVWRYNAEGAFGPAPALPAPGTVLVATRHGEVHLVDVASGDRIGKRSFGEAIEGAPVLLNGRRLVVPVASGRYGLLAYDLINGQRTWVRRGDPHTAGVLAVGDRLVAAAYDGTVRALDAATGVELWAHRPDSLAAFFATPTLVGGGRVAVADDAGRVTTYALSTGRVVWSATLDAPVHETPAAALDLLVVPTTRGAVVALDASTGAERWRHAADPGVLFASPAATPDAILVGGSDGVLRRLGLDGAVAWTQRFDGNVAAAPLLAGETVYVGTLDERFVALDLGTGREVWSTTLPGRVKSAAVATDGTLIVLAEPRHLHAFRSAEPAPPALSGAAPRQP
ncbi:MAG: PQQ-binding-like beta-propeller repeat protein [Rubricoccaceae bacterium]|nr:PQQ-binding-like beta-propeller repeat protein [Rubricoccaceae bacterium]